MWKNNEVLYKNYDAHFMVMERSRNPNTHEVHYPVKRVLPGGETDPAGTADLRGPLILKCKPGVCSRDSHPFRRPSRYRKLDLYTQFPQASESLLLIQLQPL